MSVFTTIRQSVGLISPKKQKSAVLSDATFSSSRLPSSSSDKGPVHGYLILESSRGEIKERYPLQKRITTVGRLHQGDIRIYGETVSRLHCQINVAEDGKISLQVFNVRGIKLNSQKIQSYVSSNDGDKIVLLNESDVIEIFKHRFRLEYVTRDANGKTIIPHNARLGRKSLRMSLVRAAVSEKSTSAAPLQQSQAEMEEADECAEMEESMEEKKLPSQAFIEQDKENAPVKGRRSFTFDTPARGSTRNGLWETEPRKKKVKRLGLSPIKRAPISTDTVEESDVSIVVMEEVDELDIVEEGQPVELEGKIEAENIQAGEAITTPSKAASISNNRLTQSSSPKKPSTKARRRSSFFGRAGIFAGLNLGFYPEERRNNEEAKAVESDLKVAALSTPITSPDKLQRVVTPEPRLDSYGMPRLPRSMSSPSGLSYGSPGKRRVISLRTATLIKTGHRVFEQQKLISPPPSPTKISCSSSLSAAFQSLPPLSPEKKAAAGQIPLPDSDDEEDADEVDRSLSSFSEDVEQEVQEEEVKESKSVRPLQIHLSRSQTRIGPRKSHGIPFSYMKDTKSKGKGRSSLPGKMLTLPKVQTSNDRAVKKWRKEWEDGLESSKDSPGEASLCSNEAAMSDAFDEGRDEDKVEEWDTPGNQQQAEVGIGCEKEVLSVAEAALQTEERSPLKMLRHALVANPELTALLDEITGDGTVQDDQDSDRNLQSVKSTSRAKEADQSKLFAAAATKLSRRVSEMPQRKARMNSSIAQKKKTPPISRKSAGAVLYLKESRDAPLSSKQIRKVEPAEISLTAPQPEVVIFKAGDTLSNKEEIVQQEKEIVKRSPRKRVVEPSRKEIPIAVTRSDADISRQMQRLASKSPEKKLTSKEKPTLNLLRESSDDVNSDDLQSSRHFLSDELQSSRLILEPSSPIKRTKRAAKEQAEVKIRSVLVKKPSIAVLRAISISEAESLPLSKSSSKNPSDEIKSRLRKTKGVVVAQSEPSRTTRSRSAAAKR